VAYFELEGKMDRGSKVILAAIAAGLWVNAAMVLIRPAHADDTEVWLGRIALQAASIASDLHTLVVGGPGCSNQKLCN
jgi:hypothetical protein